ncbi:hypothetical protein [Aeromicrobium sp.]|uniref:hypothetical protein n=1 Tax=Aeromicrobium sp. TaxID=1871063 RepID=UPI003D6B1B14
MNPRFRRLLIPGLLVALLVVVLVAAIAGRADGTTSPEPPVDSTVVSRIDDSRIGESSGLAVSTRHDDLAYTINDSGNAAIVYAVRISTGKVVGTTRVQANWLDTEALALRDGMLWVADTGDNVNSRADAALYALDEPGRGDGTAVPLRYPVSYDRGPQNVEAIAVHPDTGETLLLSKGPTGGLVHRLPEKLRESAKNVATATSWTAPAFTTDATYASDGRHVLVRNYPVAEVRDAETWELVRTDVLPDQQQGETIAIEPSGRSYLIGSEGGNSALIRIAFDPEAATATPTPEASPSPATLPSPDGVRVSPYIIGGLVAVVAIAIVLFFRCRSRPS